MILRKKIVRPLKRSVLSFKISDGLLKTVDDEVENDNLLYFVSVKHWQQYITLHGI